MRREHPTERRRERHVPLRRPRLRLDKRTLPTHLMSNPDHRPLHVDVLPAETKRLTLPDPG